MPDLPGISLPMMYRSGFPGSDGLWSHPRLKRNGREPLNLRYDSAAAIEDEDVRMGGCWCAAGSRWRFARCRCGRTWLTDFTRLW